MPMPCRSCLPQSYLSCHARHVARYLAHGSSHAMAMRPHAMPETAQPLRRHCRSLPTVRCQRLLELSQLALHELHPRRQGRHGRRQRPYQLHHVLAEGRCAWQLRGRLRRRCLVPPVGLRGVVAVVLRGVVVDGTAPRPTTRSAVNYWMLMH